ncbi:hypothetical protein AB5J49_36370 [Streptomyces sp. R28]|uniref:Uncharacterized protein n=1 Tax=Streptomyces sp. R28 TaxID=3238628 RepID=A0AB39Q6T1_9ACTN
MTTNPVVSACVELSYPVAVRECRRRPPLDCATARFEDVAAVRPFGWSRGERHFWPHRHDGECERRYAPGYFVRRADGSAVVVDVRA